MKKLLQSLCICFIAVTAIGCFKTTKTVNEYELLKKYNAIIDSEFKGWHIVKLEELHKDDILLWKRYRKPNEYPGIAIGKYNDNRVQTALLIGRNIDNKKQAKLLLVEDKNIPIKILYADTTGNHSYPTIHTLTQGIYTDIYDKTINIEIQHDCIAYEHIEASVTVYYYDNGKYKSLLISD